MFDEEALEKLEERWQREREKDIQCENIRAEQQRQAEELERQRAGKS